jgi:SAM-dependent methyltransferase
MSQKDPRRIVADGYDQISHSYLSRFGDSGVRAAWLRRLIDLTSQGDRILDLGCGPGIPVASALTASGRRVVGVDGSARQVELARTNVPDAEFIASDMSELKMAPASCDAVCAFYSITHLPRDLHHSLFRDIFEWLRPGGVFLASLGATDTDNWTGEWMGSPMFFSHFDAEWYVDCLANLGFRLEAAQVVQQDDEAGSFLWVVAHRPAA